MIKQTEKLLIPCDGIKKRQRLLRCLKEEKKSMKKNLLPGPWSGREMVFTRSGSAVSPVNNCNIIAEP